MCVRDAQSLDKLNSVRYDTSPLYSKVCVYVCVCGVGGGGVGCTVFSRSSRLDPYGHTGVLGSGRFSIIAGPRCRPGVLRPCVAPRPACYALGPEPGSLPQDHPGSGVVAPWLPPGQLHGISSTSPSSPCCPVCCVCIGASTAGGARGSEAASTAYSFGDFPRKDALDAARLQTCPLRGSKPRPFGCETYA